MDGVGTRGGDHQVEATVCAHGRGDHRLRIASRVRPARDRFHSGTTAVELLRQRVELVLAAGGQREPRA